MRDTGRALRLALLLLAAIGSTAPVGAQSEQERAKELFERATLELDQRNYESALALYREAYALASRAKILLNIGAILVELKREAEAADVFEEYLGLEDLDPSRKDEAARLLASLEKKVGKLSLDVKVEGALVLVDGRQLGTGPLQLVRRAMPGTRVIRVEHPTSGFRRTLTARVQAGETETVVVEGPASSAAPPTVTTTPESVSVGTEVVDKQKRQPSRWQPFLRIDVDLEGRGAVAAPGLGVGLNDAWHAFANAIIGDEVGGEIGARFTIGDGVVRPTLSAAIPVFYIDGLVPLARWAVGISVQPFPRLQVIAEAGAAYGPVVPAPFEELSFLSSVQVALQL